MPGWGRKLAVHSSGLDDAGYSRVPNPNAALFFLPVAPQFIEPSAPDKPLAFMFRGTIFRFDGTLWCLLPALLSARLGSLGIGTRAGKRIGRLVGSLVAVPGVRLACAMEDWL